MLVLSWLTITVAVGGVMKDFGCETEDIELLLVARPLVAALVVVPPGRLVCESIGNPNLVFVEPTLDLGVIVDCVVRKGVAGEDETCVISPSI